MLPLYEFHPKVLFYWWVAFAVWEWVFVVGGLQYFKASTFQEYYRRLPGWVPVAGDVLYSTLIFLTAQWIFAAVKGSLTVSPMVGFVGIAIATQWVYDLTYGFILSRLPRSSRYIDFFQRYIREVSFYAVIGDTLYLLAWLGLTWLFLRYVPLSVAIYILVASLFLWMLVKW